MKNKTLHNFFDRETVPTEEIEIRKWVEKSEENRIHFIEERKKYDAQILLAPEATLYPVKRMDSLRTRIIRNSARYAAVFVFGILITSFAFSYLENQKPFKLQTLAVPVAQQLRIELSDGTVVWLNSQTELKYPGSFKSGERRVILNGEAYFEVAPDKTAPFIVETTKGNVEVLGTKFNVKAYSKHNEFETSLMSGSVKVSAQGQQVILKPEHKVTFDESGAHLCRIEDHSEYRWREGMLCFNKEPFAKIMEKFEESYGYTILIENPDLYPYKYSAKFRLSDGIGTALRLLQNDLKFTFSRDENTRQIIIR
ncbi:MAG: FecR domain-containing protein [Bacteroidales bacterium]